MFVCSPPLKSALHLWGGDIPWCHLGKFACLCTPVPAFRIIFPPLPCLSLLSLLFIFLSFPFVPPLCLCIFRFSFFPFCVLLSALCFFALLRLLFFFLVFCLLISFLLPWCSQWRRAYASFFVFISVLHPSRSVRA